MVRSLRRELEKRNLQRSLEIDFHYLSELMDAGLKDEEIAHHMDADINIINQIREEREMNW